VAVCPCTIKEIPMSFGKRTLAIVGGGSIATSIIRQLSDEILTSEKFRFTDVVVFDPGNAVGAGNGLSIR
jgi:hypothetical protein